MNRNTLIAITIASTFVVTGCNSTSVTNKLNELGLQLKTSNPKGETFVNGQKVEKPQSVATAAEAVSVSEQSSQKVKRSWDTFEFTQAHQVSVDIAAFAIAREFDYLSPEDLKKEHGKIPGGLMAKAVGYRWKTTPGSFHNMRRTFDIGGDAYNIDFEILRKNQDTTLLIVKYWVRNDLSANKQRVETFITTKINRALSKYTGV